MQHAHRSGHNLLKRSAAVATATAATTATSRASALSSRGQHRRQRASLARAQAQRSQGVSRTSAKANRQTVMSFAPASGSRPLGERDSITARMRAAQQRLRQRGLAIPEGDIGANTPESRQRAWQQGAGMGASLGASRLQQSNSLPFPKQHIIAAVLLLVLAIIIELVGFNSNTIFFSSARYTEQAIPLPQIAQLQRSGVIINAQSPTLNLTGINQDVRTLTLHAAMGPRTLVRGTVSISDESQQAQVYPLTSFAMTTDGGSGSKVIINIPARGKVHDLVVTFARQSLQSGFLLTDVTINQRPPLNASFLRVILLWAAASLIYALGFSAIRQHKIVVEGAWYKGLNRSILLLQLILAVLFFALMRPQVATVTGWQSPSLGTVLYTTPDKSLLIDITQRQDQRLEFDPYVQQLHALLRGEMELLFTPDPRLEQLSNVYDPSLRASTQVQYLWDRAYYHGTYYSAAGWTPLLSIYLPVYLLTGKAPSMALALFIAEVYALLALYVVSNRLLRVLTMRCNPLLFVVAKLAFFASCHLLLLFLAFKYQSLMALTGIAFWAFAIACMLSLARFVSGRYPGDDNVERLRVQKARVEAAEKSRRTGHHVLPNLNAPEEPVVLEKWHALGRALQEKIFLQPWWWCLEMIFGAIAVVLVLNALPSIFLPTLALVVPMFVLFWLSPASSKDKAVASVAFWLPCAIGLGLTLWANYSRFGSVLEFGSSLLLGGHDNLHATLPTNLGSWQVLLFALLGQDFVLSGSFPFVDVVNGVVGNLPAAPHFGLLSVPLLWVLPVVVILVRRLRRVMAQHQAWQEALAAGRSVKAPAFSAPQLLLLQSITLSFVLWVVLVPLSQLFAMAQFGLELRFMVGSSAVLGLMAFIAVMLLSCSDPAGERSDASMHRGVVYVSLVLVCVVSLLLCFFMSFSESISLLATINPEFYLKLQALFDPLALAHI